MAKQNAFSKKLHLQLIQSFIGYNLSSSTHIALIFIREEFCAMHNI